MCKYKIRTFECRICKKYSLPSCIYTNVFRFACAFFPYASQLGKLTVSAPLSQHRLVKRADVSKTCSVFSSFSPFGKELFGKRTVLCSFSRLFLELRKKYAKKLHFVLTKHKLRDII